MTRTIIEDYRDKYENHFDLSYDIPRRARDIHRRGNTLIEDRGDKPIVLALRELVEEPKVAPLGAAEGADAED